MTLKEILDIEERLLKEGISTSSELNERILKESYKQTHAGVVNALVYKYVNLRIQEFGMDTFITYFEGALSDCSLFEDVDLEVSAIPALCEHLHIAYLNSIFGVRNNTIVRKKSKENLIESGAVYTQDEIAYSIVKRTMDNLACDLKDANILDFATGTGRFYKQVVRYFKEKGIEAEQSVLHQIYAIDIDPIAVNISRISALSYLHEISFDTMKTVSEHIICRNALINDLFFSELSIKPEDMKRLHVGKFDAIVSNPPYLVLKPNKRKMDEKTVESINSLAKYFRTSQYYQYAIEGMLNLYQLSLEAMMSMLKEDGQMGIICPSTLFADISASKLRKYFLRAHNVYYIKYFSEDDPLFDNVTQATCIFHLQKGTPTTNINIENHCRKYNISIDDVKLIFDENWEIPSVEEVEWKILKKLKGCSKLKENKSVRNKRGELDLTLYESYVTSEPTEYRLVRGNMISIDGLRDTNHEYVMPSFLEKKSEDFKKNDFGRKRLICQQISNQTQNIRLRFVYSESQDILGNSCNYISSSEDNLAKLNVLMNSALLNWRFKVTSTNNHINNYELDELPLIDLDLVTSDVIELDEKERNQKICSLYGLKGEEINFIIQQHYETI